jgi:microcystin-dependent protein
VTHQVTVVPGGAQTYLQHELQGRHSLTTGASHRGGGASTHKHTHTCSTSSKGATRSRRVPHTGVEVSAHIHIHIPAARAPRVPLAHDGCLTRGWRCQHTYTYLQHELQGCHSLTTGASHGGGGVSTHTHTCSTSSKGATRSRQVPHTGVEVSAHIHIPAARAPRAPLAHDRCLTRGWRCQHVRLRWCGGRARRHGAHGGQGHQQPVVGKRVV